jgi:agmatinase
MSEPMPPYLGDPEAERDFDSASVVVMPVPYEETVCWVAGTARGPEAILRASPHLEFYDEQLDAEPYKIGVWTDDMLDVSGGTQAVLDRIETRFGAHMDAGKWVLMLGGEHSITPGSVRAAARRHDGLVLVQFDAHADLRADFAGNPLSHACAMARCLDHVSQLRAVGIRSYTREEADRIGAGIPSYKIVHAWEMTGEKLAEFLAGIDGKPVYITFDVDYFDPSFMPATGTPEPGGGEWYATLRLLEDLFRRANVVAADIVELAPTAGLHHCDFSAARLAYKMIGMLQRKRATGH